VPLFSLCLNATCASQNTALCPGRRLRTARAGSRSAGAAPSGRSAASSGHVGGPGSSNVRSWTSSTTCIAAGWTRSRARRGRTTASGKELRQLLLNGKIQLCNRGGGGAQKTHASCRRPRQLPRPPCRRRLDNGRRPTSRAAPQSCGPNVVTLRIVPGYWAWGPRGRGETRVGAQARRRTLTHDARRAPQRARQVLRVERQSKSLAARRRPARALRLEGCRVEGGARRRRRRRRRRGRRGRGNAPAAPAAVGPRAPRRAARGRARARVLSVCVVCVRFS
jgi:hypothetical protein